MDPSGEIFRWLTAQSLAGVAAVVEGRIAWANAQLGEMLGYTAEELIGMPAELVVAEVDRAAVMEEISAQIAGKSGDIRSAFRARCKNGSQIPLEVYGNHGTFQGKPAAIGLFLDLTARKRAEDQVRHDALHDALTGLPNRALFMDRLGQALARMRGRKGNDFSVLFIDLDRFKVVNDSLGHMAGDELLVATSKRLLRCVRPEDTVARLGGDEFGVLLEDVPGSREAARIAEKIQRELRAPLTLGGREIVSTSSIGIAHGR
ncbi:MAG TPA: sensor domain-containing diguanylate cyclase, partial [Myxococcales bacterium]